MMVAALGGEAGALRAFGAVQAPLEWLSLLAGLFIVAATISSVVRTLVMTRGMNSFIAGFVARSVNGLMNLALRRVSSYRDRDRVRSWASSTALLSILIVWLLLFLIGYALLLNADSALTLPQAIREAGSSLFTLGFASSDRNQLTTVDFIAAATGPIVIGLLIGYLPTLYGSYNRREVDVTLLRTRAGEPNWGPELLARHALVGTEDRLPELWSTWERWAADVSESHTTYPILIMTRSANANRNWLVALLSVMDAAALSLALRPDDVQAAARVVLRQGIDCLQELALALRMEFSHVALPDATVTLTYEEFLVGLARIEAGGFEHPSTPEGAWNRFRRLRVNYEAIAYELALVIDAVPAYWSGPRKPATAAIMPEPPRVVIEDFPS